MQTRRFLDFSLLALLSAWAAYTSVLASGHFLSLVPRHRAESAWLILGGLICATVLLSWSQGALSYSAPPPRDCEAMPPRVGNWLLLAAAFAALTFAVYAPSLSFGLFSDDFALLDRAGRHEFIVRTWHFRPLPLLVWAFLQSFAPAHWVLHAANLLLHALNALLVVLLAHRLRLSTTAAVLAGTVFACFPASVEALAWPSGIQDVLLTTSCLGFVLASGCSERPRLVMPVSMVTLVAALMCKETAVVCPVLGFIAWFGVRDRWHARPIAWGLVLVAGYTALRLSMFHVGSEVMTPPSRYLAKELICRAFAALAVPFSGTELQRWPALGIATAWMFAGLLVAGAWTARRNRRLAVLAARCAAWAGVAAVPVWTAFYITADLQGSRYLYLPACGWSLLVAVMLVEWRRGIARGVAIACAVGLVFVSAAGVRSHLRDWAEASRLRDNVLTSAAAHLQRTPCAVVGFTGVPDSVRGAYVFRNGLLEALRHDRTYPTKAALGVSTDAGCTVAWEHGVFRPVQSGRQP